MREPLKEPGHCFHSKEEVIQSLIDFSFIRKLKDYYKEDTCNNAHCADITSQDVEDYLRRHPGLAEEIFNKRASGPKISHDGYNVGKDGELFYMDYMIRGEVFGGKCFRDIVKIAAEIVLTEYGMSCGDIPLLGELKEDDPYGFPVRFTYMDEQNGADIESDE